MRSNESQNAPGGQLHLRLTLYVMPLNYNLDISGIYLIIIAYMRVSGQFNSEKKSVMLLTYIC